MKRILSLLISVGCLVVALAQSSTMNVFMRNGERFVFNTDSISIITFGEGYTIENERYRLRI